MREARRRRRAFPGGRRRRLLGGGFLRDVGDRGGGLYLPRRRARGGEDGGATAPAGAPGRGAFEGSEGRRLKLTATTPPRLPSGIGLASFSGGELDTSATGAGQTVTLDLCNAHPLTKGSRKSPRRRTASAGPAAAASGHIESIADTVTLLVSIKPSVLYSVVPVVSSRVGQPASHHLRETVPCGTTARARRLLSHAIMKTASTRDSRVAASTASRRREDASASTDQVQVHSQLRATDRPQVGLRRTVSGRISGAI